MRLRVKGRFAQKATHLIFTALVIFLATGTVFAQATIVIPDKDLSCNFEVASIHLSDGDVFTHFRIENENTFHGFSFPASILIRFAYGVEDAQQVIGYPGWAGNEKYDIIAKVSDEAAANKCLRNSTALHGALRDLLQQRFALKVHNEQRQINLYSLVVIPGKLKLAAAPRTPHQVAHYPDDFIVISPPLTVTAEYATMGNLAGTLSHILDRKVTDRTGLNDRYTFKLKYSGDGEEAGTAAAVAEDRPSIFNALNEQLGLKLVPVKSSAPVIVVDHIQHPTAN